MTQTNAAPKNSPSPFSAPASHKGLFIVAPAGTKSETRKIARQSRSLGLVALALAALAAPMVWIAHAVLHALHIR